MTDDCVAHEILDDVKELIRFRTRNRDNAAKMLAVMVVRDYCNQWFDKLNKGPEEVYKPKNAILHAEREIGLLVKSENELDQELSDWLNKNVLDLLYVFSRQGHSGGTAEEMLRLFNHLARFKPLMPITADPAEWADMTEQTGRPFWQNRRQTTCFSEDGGKTFYDIDYPPLPVSWFDKVWAKVTRKPLKKFVVFNSLTNAPDEQANA
jgi:hypothetical protein